MVTWTCKRTGCKGTLTPMDTTGWAEEFPEGAVYCDGCGAVLDTPRNPFAIRVPELDTLLL